MRLPQLNLSLLANSAMAIGSEQRRQQLQKEEMERIKLDAALQKQALDNQIAVQNAIQGQQKHALSLQQSQADRQQKMAYQSYLQDNLDVQNEKDLRDQITQRMRFGVQTNLTPEGRQKHSALMSELNAIQKQRSGLSNRQYNSAMAQWLSRYDGSLLDGMVAQEEKPFKDTLASRFHKDEQGGIWIQQPDGRIDYKPPVKGESPLTAPTFVPAKEWFFGGPTVDTETAASNYDKAFRATAAEIQKHNDAVDLDGNGDKIPMDEETIQKIMLQRYSARERMYQQLTGGPATAPEQPNGAMYEPQSRLNPPQMNMPQQGPMPPLAPVDNLSNNAPSQKAPPPTPLPRSVEQSIPGNVYSVGDKLYRYIGDGKYEEIP